MNIQQAQLIAMAQKWNLCLKTIRTSKTTVNMSSDRLTSNWQERLTGNSLAVRIRQIHQKMMLIRTTFQDTQVRTDSNEDTKARKDKNYAEPQFTIPNPLWSENEPNRGDLLNKWHLWTPETFVV